ncbi:hypothetical protein RHAL1_03511 [Beijerinckiaceae bacterium RH AL1]|nr:hypothetical protein RHCH11_RHCH11_03446 [Beijerinckiaceae bacterium RH CH11]VVB48894.1 hypothetical protein RHAL8_03442 [Beijerinckiaceae bacterium RH AL8]VVC56582.1 hypothetical protein RHAL1_03511 [Beijerinckiaceae bacterium RH AL1]
MRPFPRLVSALPALALLTGAALAQEIPADQSCGGLLCDMGVLGHKVAPTPPATAPAAGVPVPPPVAAAGVADAPVAPRARRKPRVARRAPGVTAPPSVSAAASPAVPAPAAQAPSAPVAAPVEAPVAAAPSPPVAAPPPVAAAPPQAAEAADVPPPPPRNGPTFIFQSVDPRFQLGN